MIANIKDVSTSLQGRLGQYFNMNLKVNHEPTDLANILRIRVDLEKLHMPAEIEDNVTLIRDLATLMFIINGEVLHKIPVILDFTNSTVISNMYTIEMTNLEASRFNLEICLDIDSKSNYITKTSLRNTFIVPPLKEDKLFIDLEYKDSTDKIFCSIYTTIEPDFLEIKDTTHDWEKITTKNPIVQKSGNHQYIQVRGKKNGYYSYSNVIKII